MLSAETLPEIQQVPENRLACLQVSLLKIGDRLLFR
jgi:hypothetical protein